MTKKTQHAHVRHVNVNDARSGGLAATEHPSIRFRLLQPVYDFIETATPREVNAIGEGLFVRESQTEWFQICDKCSKPLTDEDELRAHIHVGAGTPPELDDDITAFALCRDCAPTLFTEKQGGPKPSLEIVGPRERGPERSIEDRLAYVLRKLEQLGATLEALSVAHAHNDSGIDVDVGKVLDGLTENAADLIDETKDVMRENFGPRSIGETHEQPTPVQ